MLGLTDQAWDTVERKGVRVLSPLARRLLRQARISTRKARRVKGNLILSPRPSHI